jgi:Arc/MetJ-type ribon-helix-helix transcriptional regulator
MPTLKLPVSDELHRFIQQRVADGGYESAAAYLLSLVNVDHKFQAQEQKRIKKQVDEALGELERGECFEYETTQQIMDDIVRRGEERLGRSRTKSA